MQIVRNIFSPLKNFWTFIKRNKLFSSVIIALFVISFILGKIYTPWNKYMFMENNPLEPYSQTNAVGWNLLIVMLSHIAEILGFDNPKNPPDLADVFIFTIFVFLFFAVQKEIVDKMVGKYRSNSNNKDNPKILNGIFNGIYSYTSTLLSYFLSPLIIFLSGINNFGFVIFLVITAVILLMLPSLYYLLIYNICFWGVVFVLYIIPSFIPLPIIQDILLLVILMISSTLVEGFADRHMQNFKKIYPLYRIFTRQNH